MKKEYNTRNTLHEAIRQEEAVRPPMPADLNARLMQRMQKEAERKQGGKRLRRLLPWIAAACAAACLIILIAIPDNSATDDALMANKTTEKKHEKMAEVTGKAMPKPLLTAVTTPEPKLKEKKRTAEKPCQSATVGKNMTDGKETLKEIQPQDIPTTECPKDAECNLTAAADAPAKPAVSSKPRILSERDIPITRPENLKYTKEELALMKKQANEAYLKWMELELEIAKYNMEQTANNNR